MIDASRIPFLAVVEVSYLTEMKQQMLYSLMTDRKLKLSPKMAEELCKETNSLDKEKMLEILDGFRVKKAVNGVNLKLPAAICNKYFEGMSTVQMAELVEQALASWFSG